ncbi:MAG TPA: hypothetical protein PKA58_26330, partial [Polyangium sp.]|nr:hypothetical protein [Polyangium sp.]
ESRSTSLVCQVLQGSDGRWSIHGTYTNEPKALVRDRSPIHTGGIKLELGGTPLTTLSGHYWTDRNTRGEMNLRFISREIANDFAAARSLAESVLAR